MRDLYLHTASPWSPKLWLPTPGCCPRRERPRCRRLACGNGGRYQPWAASPMPRCSREHVTSLVHNHPARSHASLPRHIAQPTHSNPTPGHATASTAQSHRSARTWGEGVGSVRAHHESHELLLETLACVAIVRRARYCCRCHRLVVRGGFHVFFQRGVVTTNFFPGGMEGSVN
jgi:hypothetical protein